MTWQQAIDKAFRLARRYPDGRYRVEGFQPWPGAEWEYEVRCAGPVVTK